MRSAVPIFVQYIDKLLERVLWQIIRCSFIVRIVTFIVEIFAAKVITDILFIFFRRVVLPKVKKHIPFIYLGIAAKCLKRFHTRNQQNNFENIFAFPYQLHIARR